MALLHLPAPSTAAAVCTSDGGVADVLSSTHGSGCFQAPRFCSWAGHEQVFGIRGWWAAWLLSRLNGPILLMYSRAASMFRLPVCFSARTAIS
uniref:Uncharacterized protein n=1 Tax=Takifugu rubripes TaxID=31033 RepID=A0A674P856_TAKRU